MAQQLWQAAWPVLAKLSMRLSHHPAMLFLAVYPKEEEHLCPHKNLPMTFIAVYFIIAQIWKQPRNPSAGEWVHKLWYIQMMENYPALKRNEL